MPIGIGTRRWQYLDEEECFDLWNDLGSVSLALRALINQDVRNPETGGLPSRRGVEIAAVRYALRNSEEARQKILDAFEKTRTPKRDRWAESDAAWYGWLAFRAQRALGNSESDSFMQETSKYMEEKYGLDSEEYREFYAEATKSNTRRSRIMKDADDEE